MDNNNSSKKSKRRSSIMVVEKDGKEYEMLKNGKGSNSDKPDGKKDGEGSRISDLDNKKGSESRDGITAPGDRSGNKEPSFNFGEVGAPAPDSPPNANGSGLSAKDTSVNKDKVSYHDGSAGGGSKDGSKDGSKIGSKDGSRLSAKDGSKNEGAAGIFAGGQPPSLDSPGSSKKVGFNEDKNTEHSVPRDENKSIPAEVEEKNIREKMNKFGEKDMVAGTIAPREDTNENIVQGSDLHSERTRSNVAYEGSGYKRMWFCSCFWVKRYFVLTKDGTIKCYMDKNKKGCVFLKTGDLDVVSRTDKEHEKHTYHVTLETGGREKVLAFDSADVRDAWAMKLSEVIRNNREDK